VGVTEADVRHVADLAHIAVDDADIAQLTRDLSSILGYVAQIAAAEGSAPAAPAELVRLRADTPSATDPAPLLEAAPMLSDGLVALPLVLG